MAEEPSMARLTNVKISCPYCVSLVCSKSASPRDINNVSAFKNIDARRITAAESVRSSGAAVATSAASSSQQQQSMSMQQQSREMSLMQDDYIQGVPCGCGC